MRRTSARRSGRLGRPPGQNPGRAPAAPPLHAHDAFLDHFFQRLSGFAYATSDHHHTRADIVAHAIQEAERRARRVDGFDAVVAVGDGAWDVATAGELGLGFIGLGSPERLAAIGASVSVRDYSDPEEFMALLVETSTQVW